MGKYKQPIDEWLIESVRNHMTEISNELDRHKEMAIIRPNVFDLIAAERFNYLNGPIKAAHYTDGRLTFWKQP